MGWFGSDSADTTINKGQSANTTILFNDIAQAHDWIIIGLLSVIVIIMCYHLMNKVCDRSRQRIHRRFQSEHLLNRIAIGHNVPTTAVTPE